jgi:hypothetical protein
MLTQSAIKFDVTTLTHAAIKLIPLWLSIRSDVYKKKRLKYDHWLFKRKHLFGVDSTSNETIRCLSDNIVSKLAQPADAKLFVQN